MIATYRLQLGPELDFDGAAALVPYLAKLGVSHLYLSPITESRPGSTHGYDVVDHGRLREELGGEAGFERLREACVAAGLAMVIDFVPNHAGVGAANAAWQDVLAYGPASSFATTFDIDTSKGKILLPFLGRYYGDALDAKELSIVYEGGRLYAAYFDHRYALRPESYRAVLTKWVPRLGDHPSRAAITLLTNDYLALEGGDRDRAERLRQQLAELAPEDSVREVLSELTPAEVHEILEAQRFRLAYWKTAGAEINYRRFFDINDLAGLRMELPDVFARAHAAIRALCAKDGVEGLRIDHVDGLYDPRGYLARLAELGIDKVWIEKIVAAREPVPATWRTLGTTGYEVMNDLLRLFVWPAGEGPLTRAWERFGRSTETWEEVVHQAKRLVMRTSLAGELERLSDGLYAMSAADYHTRDFTRADLAEALAEWTASLGRYRTYLPEEREDAVPVVREAVDRAAHANPAMDASIFEFVGRAILGPLSEDLEAQRQAWVGRLQQYTAPVAAKGVEDTAFYRYHRLVALNEVGGEPDRFALEAAAFHSRARYRAAKAPYALNATATHDHKRGEDLRMRLVLLSELHRPWTRLARKLGELGRPHRSPIGPSAADAYLFHQMLVASFVDGDDLAERLSDYMRKAAREAKRRTSWIQPNDGYEQALARYVRSMVEDPAVREAISPLAEQLAALGFLNTIGQTVLKHTMPGVPDLYQGTELLDLSLVDPDNRRPVDFAQRERLLADMESLLQAPDPQVLLRWMNERDDRLKLYVIAQLLRERARSPELFMRGTHRGLRTDRGSLAFARRLKSHAAIVVVPRFPSRPREPQPPRLRGLPRATYREILSGATAELVGELPTAPLPWAVWVAR